MRIICGEFKGMNLYTLTGKQTRPTTGKVKESLFSKLSYLNILTNKSYILDLFAGSGALGIETLSRGVAHVDFVDNNIDAVKIIKKNCTSLKKLLNTRYKIYKKDALYFLKTNKQYYDIVFIDPPYCFSEEKLTEHLNSITIFLKKNSIVILEYSIYSKFRIPSVFKCIFMKKYGKTKLVWLQLFKRN